MSLDITKCDAADMKIEVLGVLMEILGSSFSRTMYNRVLRREEFVPSHRVPGLLFRYPVFQNHVMGISMYARTHEICFINKYTGLMIKQMWTWPDGLLLAGSCNLLEIALLHLGPYEGVLCSLYRMSAVKWIALVTCETTGIFKEITDKFDDTRWTTNWLSVHWTCYVVLCRTTRPIMTFKTIHLSRRSAWLLWQSYACSMCARLLTCMWPLTMCDDVLQYQPGGHRKRSLFVEAGPGWVCRHVHLSPGCEISLAHPQIVDRGDKGARLLRGTLSSVPWACSTIWFLIAGIRPCNSDYRDMLLYQYWAKYNPQEKCHQPNRPREAKFAQAFHCCRLPSWYHRQGQDLLFCPCNVHLAGKCYLLSSIW